MLSLPETTVKAPSLWRISACFHTNTIISTAAHGRSSARSS